MALTVTSKVFPYEELSEADSFRLLLLQPSASHDSDLHCHILHTTLSLCDRDIIDQYTALSYVWGDPANKGSVYLNETLVTITANLDAALRDLRDDIGVLRIWADGLCIDQSNLSERASQVSLMDKIYSVADHTVIHLGSLTKDTETVLRAAPSNTSGSVIQCENIVEIDESSLLQAAWFTRVWVFQELVLSRDPWVQYGNLRARWTDICDLFTSPVEKQGSKKLQVLADMNSSRGPTRQSLLELLTARRGLGATDARDMIFAHISFASDKSSLLEYVQYNYRDSCEDVFESVAQYLLENPGSEGPDAFFPLSESNGRSERKNLASWAPDWSKPSSNLGETYRNLHAERLQLRSSSYYAFVGHPRTLAWVGYGIDIVKSYSAEFPHPEDLDSIDREEYENGLEALNSIYENVFWLAHEIGDHPHLDLSGEEEEHKRLWRVFGKKWLQILDGLLDSRSETSSNELENQERFLEEFKVWLDTCASHQLIMAGRGGGGIAFLFNNSWLPQHLPRIFAGRRLAICQTGSVVVVPRNVQLGDVIVRLAGPLMSFFLRPDEGPREVTVMDIKDALKAKNEDASVKAEQQLESMVSFDEMEVKNCTLVGECYVDKDVRWKEDQARDLVIYALR